MYFMKKIHYSAGSYGNTDLQTLVQQCLINYTCWQILFFYKQFCFWPFFADFIARCEGLLQAHFFACIKKEHIKCLPAAPYQHQQQYALCFRTKYIELLFLKILMLKKFHLYFQVCAWWFISKSSFSDLRS